MRSETIDDVVVAHLDIHYDGLDDQAMDDARRFLLDLVDQRHPPKLLIDLSETDYFGSTFLEILFRIWNRVKRENGRMGVCGLREQCLEIVKTARLDTLLPLYSDVPEGLRLIASAE